MDSLTPVERSERMSRVRHKNTKPEMVVRRLVHGMGYRFRLHAKDLPGSPDLVFRSRRSVIFVHGCFWHRHSGCRLARLPKSRTTFWSQKLEENQQRDRRNQEELRELGWSVLVVWECELRDLEGVGRKLKGFLNNETGKQHDEIG
ncbi:very short patch repair endonuclease [Marinobacter lacisalsi]|uniref:Very short patch repair endonuclease n=1 Tax=Marinobacter lacisalsi TaxID=475979 RepID=A0ABV8QD96_9GAMM